MTMSTIVPVHINATPQQVFSRLGPRPLIALLESSKIMPELSGWSYVTGPALATLETRGNLTALTGHDEESLKGPLITWRRPFDGISDILSCCAMMNSQPQARPEGLKFAAGLVGHLGYDLARQIERLPELAHQDPSLPDLRLHVVDHLLAFDHAAQQWYFCTQAMPWVSPKERTALWSRTLAQAQQAHSEPVASFEAGPLRPRTAKNIYLEQVEKLLGYIAAGDIFQANLSHRLEGPFSGDAFALYQEICRLNPAPFAAYIEAEDFTLASVSPERFLKRTGQTVWAHPIKGTRPRGPDPSSDKAQRQNLIQSEKDRAENLMIVDLMRNDLGRVAQTGTVHTEALFRIEAHPSVWQMVSTIKAQLSKDTSAIDLLKACWPPGSMTGAPKVRAMEIIEALEPVRRGPYAGAIGYFDISGDLDLSVVIRTAIVSGQRVMLQLGGAVVADSNPEAELAETYAKGKNLLRVLTPENPTD
ncbi:MAG: aminodeoxychorismate synthase component I [Burkholderiales bacterium]